MDQWNATAWAGVNPWASIMPPAVPPMFWPQPFMATPAGVMQMPPSAVGWPQPPMATPPETSQLPTSTNGALQQQTLTAQVPSPWNLIPTPPATTAQVSSPGQSVVTPQQGGMTRVQQQPAAPGTQLPPSQQQQQAGSPPGYDPWANAAQSASARRDLTDQLSSAAAAP